MDPGAVWDGEWGRSMMGVLVGGGYRRRGSLGVNLGRPIVTNGDILSSLCKSDALFPNYIGEDLRIFFCCF